MNKYEEKSGQKTRPLDDIHFDSYKRKSFCDNLSADPKSKQLFSLTQHRQLGSPDLAKKKNYLQDTSNY